MVQLNYILGLLNHLGIFYPWYQCLPVSTIRHYYTGNVRTFQTGSKRSCVNLPTQTFRWFRLATPQMKKLAKSIKPHWDGILIGLITRLVIVRLKCDSEFEAKSKGI